MTFRITAHKKPTGWLVRILGSLVWMEPKEYDAFCSLLMPNKKADFTIDEFDEAGRKIS